MSFLVNVLKIQRLALEISESGVAHVFVVYSGHVDQIHVTAYPADTSYKKDEKRTCLVDKAIYLDAESESDIEQTASKLREVIVYLDQLMLKAAQ
mgnify:CR=1 FL=1